MSAEEFLDRKIVLRKKRKSCYSFQDVRRHASLPARRGACCRRETGAKIWREAKIRLSSPQVLVFSQNGRRNLWKYLEKKAANLEMFGLGLQRLARSVGGRRIRRAFSSARPSHRAGYANYSNGSPLAPAISLFVECGSEAQVERLAANLSDQGATLMPPGAYGFSRRFARIADRYGVSWRLNLSCGGANALLAPTGGPARGACRLARANRLY